MRDRELNRRRMAGLLARWRSSGRTLSGFARAHGVSRDKLEYWRRRLGRPSSSRAGRRKVPSRRAAVAFAPVQLAAATAPAPATAVVEVSLADGVRVAVGEGVTEELLGVVLAALRRAC